MSKIKTVADFTKAGQAVFAYGANDYVQNATWSEFGKGKQLSMFDREIWAKWDAAMAAGRFKYRIDELVSRTVPGKRNYLLQLNCKRATERRTPEQMGSMQKPFDPTRFNFTKVKPEEILFSFQCLDDKRENLRLKSVAIETSSLSQCRDFFSDHVSMCDSGLLKDSHQTKGMIHRDGSSAGNMVHDDDAASLAGSAQNGVENYTTSEEGHPDVKPSSSSPDQGGRKRVNLCENMDINRLHDKKEEGRHLVLINISPLEYGHVLLVPDVDACLPQRLTRRGVRLAVDLLLLSSHPGWKVGFNSLCALASVNHQHVHGWYLDRPMNIESAVVKVSDHLYELAESYPIQGFAIQLHGLTVSRFAHILYKVLDHLQRTEVAHNFFLTRGQLFDTDAPSDQSTVRAYIWPRKSVTDLKTYSVKESLFNVAVAELSGHVPMYVQEKFDEVTESYIEEQLAAEMLPAEQFASIRSRIVELLSKDLSL